MISAEAKKRLFDLALIKIREVTRIFPAERDDDGAHAMAEHIALQYLLNAFKNNMTPEMAKIIEQLYNDFVVYIRANAN